MAKMNSPSQVYRWTRSITPTFSVKRHTMQKPGYYLISLSELLMRSSQLLQCRNIVHCNQKTFIVVRPERNDRNKNIFKQLSGALKKSENDGSAKRITNFHREFFTTSSSSATAAYTTHGEGDVDMDSKEFRQNLETYSRYQPCPVSIGNYLKIYFFHFKYRSI